MGDLSDKAIAHLIEWYNYLTLGIAGAFGVFVRHIYVKKNSLLQNFIEYLAGAVCSIYGANILCLILCRMLLHYSFFIQDGSDVQQKLLSLSAFLCGMFGLSLCEYAFNYLQKF